MAKLIKYKACGNDVVQGVKKCLNCGKYNRCFFRKHKILTVLLVIAIILIFGNMGEKHGDNTNDTVDVSAQSNTSATTEQNQLKLKNMILLWNLRMLY